MAMVGISDALDVVGKIPWYQTMQSLVNEHSQLEINVDVVLLSFINVVYIQ